MIILSNTYGIKVEQQKSKVQINISDIIESTMSQTNWITLFYCEYECKLHCQIPF